MVGPDQAVQRTLRPITDGRRSEPTRGCRPGLRNVTRLCWCNQADSAPRTEPPTHTPTLHASPDRPYIRHPDPPNNPSTPAQPDASPPRPAPIASAPVGAPRPPSSSGKKALYRPTSVAVDGSRRAQPQDANPRERSRRGPTLLVESIAPPPAHARREPSWSSLPTRLSAPHPPREPNLRPPRTQTSTAAFETRRGTRSCGIVHSPEAQAEGESD